MDDRHTLARAFLGSTLTWAALCALLALTYTLAYVPMGKGNFVVSLIIATIKSLLVGLIFMRLARDTALVRLAALAGPLWVFFMFLLTGTDYFTR